MKHSVWLGVLTLTCLALTTAVFAKASAPDPEKTRTALRALLAIADEPIKPGSSCYDKYVEEGPTKVRDLLAMNLAYLYKGKNIIAGECQGGNEAACSLSITHSAGESVYSARIRFKAVAGRALPDSLACILTP